MHDAAHDAVSVPEEVSPRGSHVYANDKLHARYKDVYCVDHSNRARTLDTLTFIAAHLGSSVLFSSPNSYIPLVGYRNIASLQGP